MLFQNETTSTFQSYLGRDGRTTRHKKANLALLVESRLPRTVSDQWSGLSELDLLPGNSQEIQHFLFFRTATASDLAGGFDFGFWTYDILQASHLYPALWHATAALGAIHRRFITDSSLPYNWHSESDHHIQFALAQYTKSIQNLTKLLSGPMLNERDKMVVLTTCVLFTCLCTLTGFQNQALMHISNGMKLIQEWGLEESSLLSGGTSVTVNMLVLTLTQLDSQGQYIRYGLRLGEAEQVTEPLMVPSYPLEPFPTCLQAYVELERLINPLSRLDANKDYISPEHDLAIAQQKKIYFQIFIAWETRFEGYLATKSESIDENLITLLRLRRYFAHTLLDDPGKGELGYDQYVHQYMMIVALARRILEARSAVIVHRDGASTINGAPEQINFSLSIIIAEPLLFTAMRCRQRTIRHRALQLLKKHPRREGIVNSILATRLLEAYIDFEEKSCPMRGYYSHGDGSSSINSTTCSIGPWICQNHRLSFSQFMKTSGLGAQGMQRWRK